MFIPEAIAYQALKQNLLASELGQSVRNILRSKTDPHCRQDIQDKISKEDGEAGSILEGLSLQISKYTARSIIIQLFH